MASMHDRQILDLRFAEASLTQAADTVTLVAAPGTGKRITVKQIALASNDSSGAVACQLDSKAPGGSVSDTTGPWAVASFGPLVMPVSTWFRCAENEELQAKGTFTTSSQNLRVRVGYVIEDI